MKSSVVPNWGRFPSLAANHAVWKDRIRERGEDLARSLITTAQLRRDLREHAKWMYEDDAPGLRGDSQFQVAAHEYALRLRAKTGEASAVRCIDVETIDRYTLEFDQPTWDILRGIALVPPFHAKPGPLKLTADEAEKNARLLDADYPEVAKAIREAVQQELD